MFFFYRLRKERQEFFIQAMMFYMCALKSAIALYGPQSDAAAVSYADVAAMLEQKGLYQLALIYHEQSLAIRIEVVFSRR